VYLLLLIGLISVIEVSINLSITNGEISLINYSSHENDVSEIASIKNYDEQHQCIFYY